MTDDDGDIPSLISINLDRASFFMTGEYPDYNIYPYEDDIGYYTISVNLTDNNVNPLYGVYSFIIKVEKYVNVSNSTNSTSNSTS